MKLKAYHVYFDTPSSTGFSEVLLVHDEKDLETALEAKSTKGFKVGNLHSKIIMKKEIPLSQVKLAELSIVEFLMIKDLEQ